MNALDPCKETAVPSVLITSFEPYGRWEANASWLAVVELTRDLPSEPRITTRRYPVDYNKVPQLLADDLAANYDFALHLGQAPGSASVQLEAFALNIRTSASTEGNGQFCPLCDTGPPAYASELPLEYFALRLRAAGIPTSISHHAGTYLCNATLYWSQHLAREKSLATRSAFVHLPLDVSQATAESPPPASLAATASAEAIRQLLALLTEQYRATAATV